VLLRVFAEVILQVIAVQMQMRRCTGAKVESSGDKLGEPHKGKLMSLRMIIHIS